MAVRNEIENACIKGAMKNKLGKTEGNSAKPLTLPVHYLLKAFQPMRSLPKLECKKY
jgi:hypothetical protein